MQCKHSQDTLLKLPQSVTINKVIYVTLELAEFALKTAERLFEKLQCTFLFLM